MLYSDLEALIKAASAKEEIEKTASEEAAEEAQSVDALIAEIDKEIEGSMEKRASKVAIAKVLAALDILA